MNMDDLISKDSIKLNVKTLSKKRLLQDISNLAQEHLGVSGSELYSSLQKREILGPTGIGNGVAIPHVKIRGINKLSGFFIILEKAIDFESADNQPVDLVFVLLAPENNNGSDHLKALAMISRCFKDKNTRSKLRLTKNMDSVYAILTEKEDSKAA
ncbi:hypothetical protein CBE37_01330 [bacterium TMED277]|nr:MAG: hypothetical protein CBE37_01330 [bacterium TMED277]|tara:strand:- start:7069 stop:7536 length:468 start_codon:yes stop_codon:yes gene_type:complete